MRKLAILGTLFGLLAGPADAFTTTDRDAPWRLTGISADQRKLKLVYEGSGCLRDDGRPVVDTSTPGRVSIRVVQTVDVPEGPYEACILPLYVYPLTVPLGERLGGRFVTGAPDFDTEFAARRVPRLVGLRKTDARRAARRQSLRARFRGDAAGVVVGQTPRAGTKLPLSRGRTQLTLRVAST